MSLTENAKLHYMEITQQDFKNNILMIYIKKNIIHIWIVSNHLLGYSKKIYQNKVFPYITSIILLLTKIYQFLFRRGQIGLNINSILMDTVDIK